MRFFVGISPPPGRQAVSSVQCAPEWARGGTHESTPPTRMEFCRSPKKRGDAPPKSGK